MTRALLATAFAASLLSVSATAQQTPTLLNYTWSVEACKSTKDNSDCQDPRKLLPDTDLGVFRNMGNELWFHILLPNPIMKIQVPVVDIKFDQNSSDDAPKVILKFADFTESGNVVQKQLTIERIRESGNDVGQQCITKLEEYLGRDFGQNGTHADHCQEDDLIYWRIDTMITAPDPIDSLLMIGTPGDGHGTGSDGGQ